MGTTTSAAWMRALAGTTVVVKFGGNAMVDASLFDSFAADIVALQAAGVRVAVVHGGGPQISAELETRGIVSEFRAGLRVTSLEAVDAVRAALTAVGVELATAITAAGGSAQALTGETQGLFIGRKTGAVIDGELVDLGQVGEVASVDTAALEALLDAGRVPVIASISPDGSHPDRGLNVNADTAAGAVAAALAADRLVMLTDVAGLYRRWPDPDSLVTTIDTAELAELLPALESGMIPKMRACLDAVRAGVGAASIIDGRVAHALTAAPFGVGGTTVIPAGSATPVGLDEWPARHEKALMRTFAPPQAMLVRGEGAWVWDADGNRLLDFLAGIAVNALGHAHPVFVKAVTTQAATLAHVSNYFATPPQLALAERLRRLSGAGSAGRVFFANSGTEANEAALKLARLTGRPRILSLRDSFHGRTMGALSITGKPALWERFGPMIGGVEFLDSTIDALDAALGDDVAALFVEPIKGEAGVLPLPDGYLAAARELTRRHGALLVVDEIQTGAGRTGHWFGYQAAGIVPDAITLAKGLGGGFPIGALVTFGDTSELYGPGQHGSTFGGNPLATATADAVLAEIERADLVGNASRRGEQLREILLGLDSPLISEVRGAGLLIGVGLTAPVATRIAAAAIEQGLIVNAAGESTIRLAPPLTVGDDELAEFRTRFAGALATVQKTADIDRSQAL